MHQRVMEYRRGKKFSLIKRKINADMFDKDCLMEGLTHTLQVTNEMIRNGIDEDSYFHKNNKILYDFFATDPRLFLGSVFGSNLDVLN